MEGDDADLRLIDANTRQSGDRKLTFIGLKDFSIQLPAVRTLLRWPAAGTSLSLTTGR